MAKKIKKLKQVNGRQEETFEPTTLDQIWGDRGNGVYETSNENDYFKTLKAFNKTDLQSHASELGIMPIDNRERLENILLNRFRKHLAQFTKPSIPKVKDSKLPNEKILKILSEGR